MEQRNCKNCGAPIEHSYNHKCPYCKTLFDFNVQDNKKVELHSWDMVDLKLREIEREHITNNIRLVFEGYKLESPVVYEYDGENTFVSKSINYINPPKSYFFVEIPIFELRKYGIDFLKYRIRELIRPSEYENVFRQIQEQYYKIERGIYYG